MHILTQYHEETAAASYKAGDKIQVRWEGDGKHYGAKIVKAGTKAGTWVIKWDEPGNPLAQYSERSIKSATAAPKAAATPGKESPDVLQYPKAAQIYKKLGGGYWPELEGYEKKKYQHLVLKDKAGNPVGIGAFKTGKGAMPGIHWDAEAKTLKGINALLGTKTKMANFEDIYDIPGTYLTGITVDTAKRGQGLGGKLLDGLVKQAKKAGSEIAILTITNSRTAMIKAATKRGFVKVGTSDLGSPGDYEYLYIKKL